METQNLKATPSEPATSLGALKNVLSAAERFELTSIAAAAPLALSGVDLDANERRVAASLLVALEAVLSPRATGGCFVERVRATVTRLLEMGGASVEDVARELAVSRRTLQRRLETEGTTYGAVCDEARRAAALEHLRNPKLGIKEAAFRLGFSEPSTFYRAFRRWTGDTPANYRRLKPTLQES